MVEWGGANRLPDTCTQLPVGHWQVPWHLRLIMSETKLILFPQEILTPPVLLALLIPLPSRQLPKPETWASSWIPSSVHLSHPVVHPVHPACSLLPHACLYSVLHASCLGSPIALLRPGLSELHSALEGSSWGAAHICLKLF